MAYRAARLGVAAVLMSSLSGCLWLALTESTDNRTYRFDGTVTRAGGTPVANARVEITDGFEYHPQGPPPAGAAPCSGEIGGMVRYVTTDARGKYLLEDRREDEIRGFCLSVRVIPAPGSGLAEAVVKGEAYRFEQPVSRESLTHRRVDVVLPAAPKDFRDSADRTEARRTTGGSPCLCVPGRGLTEKERPR